MLIHISIPSHIFTLLTADLTKFNSRGGITGVECTQFLHGSGVLTRSDVVV